MSLAMRLAVSSSVVLLAVGCGGAKLDRDSAARVALASGETSNGARGQGGLLSLLQSGQFGGSSTVSCSAGGQATLTLSGADLSGGLSLTFNITFDDCTEPMWDDPETAEVEKEEVTQDGKLAMTLTAAGSAQGATVTMVMKGRLDLSGAVKDFVELDLTQELGSSVSGNSVSVFTTLNGSIKTSGETFTYDNESYRFTATGEFTREGGGA